MLYKCDILSCICHMSLLHNYILQKNIKDSRIMILYHIFFRIGVIRRKCGQTLVGLGLGQI